MRYSMAVSLALLVGTLALAPAVGWATPVVENVLATQRATGDRAVDISYDLSGGGGPMTVTVLVSNDNGDSYTVTPRTQFLTGAVGPGIANATGHTIVWDAMADVPEIYWPATRVRVIATEEQTVTPTPSPTPSTSPSPTPVPVPVSLVIESDAPAPVHQLGTQQFTFTFDTGVSGFDVSDIDVTGATKGALQAVSTSVYTLAVTGTGGTVSVSVPNGAAASIANAGLSQAASTSNFFQDTWTIELQASPLVTMDLIRIPAGTFMMGSPEDELSRNSNETQHEVTLTQDFYLGKTEVTQNQWAAIQSFPASQSFVGGTMPVHNVSHNDIGSWFTALNTAITEPGTFSLPTESQWEYAARAGTTTRFNFGDGLSTNENCTTGGGRETNVWYCGNSGNSTQLVGQKSANAWGLRDMHGNVWEWCSDWYGTYPAGPVTDPTGPGSGSFRVVRGGGWFNSARICRSAQRASINPSSRVDDIGFRVLAVR